MRTRWITAAVVGIACLGSVTLLATGSGAAAAPTITIAADAKSTTFGGADPAITYSVFGLAAGDSLTTTPTCVVDSPHTAAGKYPITCSGAAADPKYTIKYVAANLTVAKATVTVTAANKAKLYRASDPTFTYSVSGLIGDDTLLTPPTCGVSAVHDNAGTYQIACTGADAGPNYTVKYTNGFLSVLKAALTITANNKNISVGADDPAFTFSTTGLKSGDSLVTPPTCGVADPHTAVGTYPITCSGADAGKNYTISYEDGTLTVGRAIVYVAADPQTITYGQAEPTYTYQVTGFLGSDSLSATPTCQVKAPHTDAGTYAISCSGAALDSTKYLLVYRSADLTIAPAPITITATDMTRLYGSKDVAPTYTVSGLLNGDKLKSRAICTVPGEHVHVGTYTEVCDRSNPGVNYVITYVPGTLTITKANSVLTGAAPLLKTTLTATLVSAGGLPEAGATVVFTTRSTALCTSVTDSTGVATCKLTGLQGLTVTLNGGYTLTYNGSSDLYPSSKNVTLL